MSKTADAKAVYLAQALGTDLYKIGISTSPSRRVTQFGPPCELVHVVDSDDPRVVEKRLLRKFNDHIVSDKTEWLSLSESTVETIIDWMNDLGEPREQVGKGQLEDESVESETTARPVGDRTDPDSRTKLERHLPQPERLTANEVASALGMSRRSVYRWVQQGLLETNQEEGRGRHQISEEQLADFLGEEEAAEVFNAYANDEA
ncbi:MAG: GIY-YIG nuclease family protein [Salinibacter sp.]